MVRTESSKAKKKRRIETKMMKYRMFVLKVFYIIGHYM
jgi:hypothetical protein